jgi:hypothetical protein
MGCSVAGGRDVFPSLRPRSNVRLIYANLILHSCWSLLCAEWRRPRLDEWRTRGKNRHQQQLLPHMAELVNTATFEETVMHHA